MATPVSADALQQEVQGARFAALKLATLPPRDRRWVLQQLPQDEREALQALLTQLPLARLERLPAAEAQSILDLAESRLQPVPQPASDQPVVAPAGPMERASVDDWVKVLRELPEGCAPLLQARLPANRRHVLAAAHERIVGKAAMPLRPAATDSFVAALIEAVEWRLTQELGAAASFGSAMEPVSVGRADD